jgi:hypothetical protein
VHVDIVIVPERHNKNHAIGESITHTLEATLRSKVVGVAEHRFLVLAEVVVDRVAADASDVGSRLVEDLAALDIFATDLNEVTASCVVGGNELGDDCEWLGGVDGLARAVESGVAHPERVEIATVLVAVTLVAVAITIAASGVRSASCVARIADVGSQSVGDAVGFPDIHLVTAGAGSARACVRVVGRSLPAVAVSFSLNELDVLGTLSITVASSKLGTSLVCGGQTTICWHGHEVQSTVETTCLL